MGRSVCRSAESAAQAGPQAVARAPIDLRTRAAWTAIRVAPPTATARIMRAHLFFVAAEGAANPGGEPGWRRLGTRRR